MGAKDAAMGRVSDVPSNLRAAWNTFKDDSFVDALLGVPRNFGRANRRFLKGLRAGGGGGPLSKIGSGKLLGGDE